MGVRRYAVFGAGRVGCAAAYDLAMFGGANAVIIAEKTQSKAAEAAERINALLRAKGCAPIVCAGTIDAARPKEVRDFLLVTKTAGLVNATTEELGRALLVQAAIDTGCDMADVGGTQKTFRGMRHLDQSARRSGVAIMPDCGMSPGFATNLARAALDMLAIPYSLKIYCGGIPEYPGTQFDYTFPPNIRALEEACSGNAEVIRDGVLVKEECLAEMETVLIPDLAVLEAALTSDGMWRIPRTFKRAYPSLETLEYRTLRYPGHWRILKDLAREGKIEDEFRLFVKQQRSDRRDMGIVHIRCEGVNKEGNHATVILEVLDKHDPETGFTAVERLAGFHASIMLIAAVNGLIGAGVNEIESVDPQMVIAEFARRGIVVDTTVSVSGGQ